MAVAITFVMIIIYARIHEDLRVPCPGSLGVAVTSFLVPLNSPAPLPTTFIASLQMPTQTPKVVQAVDSSI
jgi:hypothetical protein